VVCEDMFGCTTLTRHRRAACNWRWKLCTALFLIICPWLVAWWQSRRSDVVFQ